MKKIIIALLFILSAKIGFAQKDSLAFDERNKYIYYQTVEQAGLNKDTMYKRALYFTTKAYPKGKFKLLQADEQHGVVTGTSSIVVPKRSLISSGMGGEITYLLRIEVKDSKYRYWFTDFTFTPYKRDRYGMDVPTAGISIPMEQAKEKLDKKDIAVYLDKMLQNSRQDGAILKTYMLKISALPKKAPEIRKISTKDW